MHFLTDGREKYIWFPTTGAEQLFDLGSDRDELVNLAEVPGCGDRVELWRQRIVDLLGRRGDGFSDGEKLLVREKVWGPEVSS